MKSRFAFLLLAAGICLMAGCGSKKKEIPITTVSAEARDLFIQGRERMESGQRIEAISLMKKAIGKDPDFAQANLALYSLGAENHRGYLEKAVQSLDKVSEGEKLYILIAQAGQNGDPVKIEEHTRKLLELYPEDKRAHAQMALFLFSRQQYQDAIGEFQKAIALDKKYALAYNMMGYSNIYLGNPAEAEESLRVYMEMAPMDPNSHDSYAEILLKQGKFQESIDEYQKALSIKPDFYGSYSGLVTNLCLLGKFEEAREKVMHLASLTSDPYVQYDVHYLNGMINLYEEGPMRQSRISAGTSPFSRNCSMTAPFHSHTSCSARIDVSRNRLVEAAGQYRQARDFVRKSAILSGPAKEGALSIVLVGEVELAVAKGDAAEARTKAEQYKKYAETTRKSNRHAGMARTGRSGRHARKTIR